MAPSKIRKALGAVKDKTSIGLAKAGNNSISDLDVAIIKATRHEEQPPEEKYIREILSLTSYSRAYVSACINTLSRRLNKTRNWTVALKTLILIHRLLSEGDQAYEQEIFFATRRGTRLLNMSDFRDTSQSGSWDFSAFVRTFALYLDERLEFRMHGRRNKSRRVSSVGDDEEEAGQSSSTRATPVREMKIQKIFTRTQHLQQLLERFLACRPTGSAKTNRVVTVALYPLVKESFQIYFDIMEIMGILIDRFMELEVPDCVKVYEIFSRISKQFDDLDQFYSWCKTVGIARSSEYPEVEKIPSKKLEVMDEFIRDKMALVQSQKSKIHMPKEEVIVEPKIEPTEEEPSTIKALPAPEIIEEVTPEEEKEELKEEEKDNDTQQEADLLNLNGDAITGEEQGNKLALALFAGEAAGPPAWEAFTTEDESADWETALVQSASHLSNQKASLGGGFDMLLLDGMYQQANAATAATGYGGNAAGSASSMALIGGTPGLLALPAPQVSGGEGRDPFAESLAVPPPSYVQMVEMEKKQQLLVEEQVMWQQYARDGMQGPLSMGKLQNSPYSVGG
ncbi:putative clathrin assembly protein At1g03050 [Magnolia sinica]|uniref:putative clathrin assembly protein At1g03050 n=1 Tax=Magnolia sinica TaxID=86752 RepID=UPI0026588B78|nr:putative clathrin assembly protein At1g03050 [Magnolia sinica]